MLTTHELLALAKAKQNIPSNYRLARVLDAPESTVKRWNTGKGQPDDAYAAKLADLAGLDAGAVVASIRAEREASGPLHDLWVGIAKRLETAGLAALAVILSLFVGGGPDAGAMASTLVKQAPALEHVASVEPGTVCILC
ncbi:MAG: hypothetical protein ABI433_07255 [Burkholderiaceae bacterium]